MARTATLSYRAGICRTGASYMCAPRGCVRGAGAGKAHSCVLVRLGVCLDSSKDLIMLTEGLRKSTDSSADLPGDSPDAACANTGWPSATAP